jgi:YVTN family beta-propeller protein
MISSFRPLAEAVARAATVIALSLAAVSPSAGDAPLAGEEGAPTSAVLLVLNKSDDTLAFVDPASMEPVKTVAVGHAPHEVQVSPDGRRAYVANYGTGPEPGNTISVVDVARREVVSTIDLGEFKRPHGLAITADGRRLYVTVEANQAVIEIDTAGERIARSFATEQRVSHMCALTPDGKKLYVANIGSESVTVIDLDKAVSSQIAAGDGPEGIDVSPDGHVVWVANRGSGDIMVIDTGSDEVVHTMESGEMPIRLKFTPDGKRVLVSNARGNEIAVFDAEKRSKIGVIDTGQVPIGILIEPGGKNAWVAQTQSDRVSRLDIEALEVTGHVSPGREPDGLGWAAMSPAPTHGNDR